MHLDQIELHWKRRGGLRKVHVVALLVAVVVPMLLVGLFKQMERAKAAAKPERQVFASIDLRIGNPMFSAQQGEEQARKDIEADALQWQTLAVEPPPSAATQARAESLKQRFGLTRRYRGEVSDPVVLAYVEGYNRVAKAEIERKFGAELARRVERGDDRLAPKPAPAATVP